MTATKNDEEIFMRFNPELGKKYNDALSKLKTNLSTLPADAKAAI